MTRNTLLLLLMSATTIRAEGSLTAASGVPCPLKHTSVHAEVSGPVARVSVTQEFVNSSSEKIEAVYTFPLPPDSAVDDMRMLVGSREVRGLIKRREEAQAVYEAARAAGHVAALLDQDRPNIFTQSVANIMPGEQVKITISYVEIPRYDSGWYEFRFPMVVGPRYVPGAAAGRQGGGWSSDTDRVPDASRVTPQAAPKGTRAGHDISLELALDSGVALNQLSSPSHEVDIVRSGASQANVRLRDLATIPNKDFILRYEVAGQHIEDALLTHTSSKGGFFTLLLQPPERVTVRDVTPKELVFVLDTSGSMMGFPIEKAKETLKLGLEGLYPQDTFNLITFSGDEHILFPSPVPATRENIRIAQEFLASRRGSGGTEMMKAIRAALDPSDKQDHLRIACFLTDGYVGNDMEIIAEVQKHKNARVFAFGIGSAVNHFLLDSMTRFGSGDVQYVGLQDDGSAAAERFHERVRNPLLTNILIDWSGLPVSEVYPRRIPDLFSAKPVVVTGRYSGAASGVIRLRGSMSGKPFSREIRVNLAGAESRHDSIESLWARSRIDDLMSQDLGGVQAGTMRSDLKEAVTQTGLDYRLMTQFTSFVAVEEMTITDNGKPRRIEVPVEMPEGVSHEGVFGAQAESRAKQFAPAAAAYAMKRPATGMLSGVSTYADTAPVLLERGRRAKMDPALEHATAQSKFVRDGKAEIQVWLKDTSPATLEKLKKLGFEIILQPKTAKLVIGRIDLAKLRALAELAEVRFMAPSSPSDRGGA